jgi:Uma2 family endonuclease
MQTTRSYPYVPMADPRVPPYPPIELVSEDNQNMDSEWHFMAITVLLDSIRLHLAKRTDYYAGGNMFIYFNEQQARDRDFRGPDFFFVSGRPLSPPREYWAVWEEEGKFPNVIIELLSPSTARMDLGIKKDVYQDIFKTPEYFCYDPNEHRILGWRLEGEVYCPIEPSESGRLWSDELHLWVGPWAGRMFPFSGSWVRFFDLDGRVLPTSSESMSVAARAQRAAQRQAEAERDRAETESERAEFEWERAETERARAEAEHKRADSKAALLDAERARAEAERLRAEAAEAELARLRAQLGDAGKSQS